MLYSWSLAWRLEKEILGLPMAEASQGFENGGSSGSLGMEVPHWGQGAKPPVPQKQMIFCKLYYSALIWILEESKTVFINLAL